MEHRDRDQSIHSRPSLAIIIGMGVLLIGLSEMALAHKLQVHAFAEGRSISGSTYYAGGGAVSAARIELRDPSGALLAELTPDEDGRFTYEARAAVEHRILAVTPDGHRAEWIVASSELVFDEVGLGQGSQTIDTRLAVPQDSGTRGDQTPVAASTLDPALEAAIERALARQIRPLREQLIATEERIRLHDILGGLGYIIGLTGLALWWRSRVTRNMG